MRVFSSCRLLRFYLWEIYELLKTNDTRKQQDCYMSYVGTPTKAQRLWNRQSLTQIQLCAHHVCSTCFFSKIEEMSQPSLERAAL